MSKSTSKRAKQSIVRAANTECPSPFEKAPNAIKPFLDQLDPSQIYITHIDRHPREYKRQIFLIPVVLNATIAVLLAWRLYVAAPKYLALLQILLGYASAETIDTVRTTRKEQIYVVLRRTLMMALDFLLFRFVGPWPLTFFLERPANPVTWRWKLGCRSQEVIVRVSRNWSGTDLMNGTKRGDQNPFFKTRITPAIEAQQMRKTGYLMMDGSWDLDFGLMQDAHALIAQDKLKMHDIDKIVLAHQDGAGWLAWRFDQSNDVMDDRNQKMMATKELLTSMGKEDLFWKWQEIVEGEKDAEGGFTQERQKRVAERVAEEFKKDGVDFDRVMKSVGGAGDVPTDTS